MISFMKTPGFLIIVLGGIIPIVGGAVLDQIFSDFRFDHHPLHALVEGIGAFAAVCVALLVLILRHSKELPPYYIWISSGLLGMGILDGFHAAMYAGQPFVLTHSLATFVGGILFSMVWVPQKISTSTYIDGLPLYVSLIMFVFGLAAIFMPDLAPNMLNNGKFTLSAQMLNMIGGLGFLLCASYFIFGKIEIIDTNITVFSTHAFLFGVAALLFEMSQLWDSAWWLWHILRFIAYMVVVFYFVMVCMKIKKQIEEALKAEIEFNALQKQFIRMASHEFRTPVSIIDLAVQRLMKHHGTMTDVQLEDRFSKIRKATIRITNLMDSTLYAAKFEEGISDYNPQNCNLSEIISETIETQLRIANDYEITTDLHDLPDVFFADSQYLKQIISHILDNAIKYSPLHKIINIKGWTEQNLVVITITDYGIGISAQDISKMFIRFFRARSVAGIPGTGIGLNLVEKLLEIHGGNIHVQSVEGKGSIFKLTLPIMDTT